MRYSSRFFLYAPLALFLAITFGVGVHWWLAASALSARLQAMNGREITPGVTLRFASRTIAGFPFSLDTVFRGFSLRIDTPHGPSEWQPEKFAMHALTYGRDKTIFEAAGKQELHWTKDDGTARNLVFAVGSLHASAIRDPGGLARFDLDLVGFGSQDADQHDACNSISGAMGPINSTLPSWPMMFGFHPNIARALATASPWGA